MIYTKKYKTGDTVTWLDSFTNQRKRGVLTELICVVGELDANGEHYQDVNTWCWDIVGEDGKTYSFEEEALSLIN